MKKRLIEQITNRIMATDPYKIILFGSAVNDTEGKDSDIDILVVTNDNIIPKSYRENLQIYLKISSCIKDIKKTVPVDLIVHTKPMYKKFINQNSLFSIEVIEKGKVLYEKNHEGMVKSST